MLTLDRVECGAATVLRVQGEIDEDGINALRLGLMACIADRRYHVVLNLSGVVFLSYMGVGALVERLGQLRTFNGDLKLACLNLQGRRLLRMMGLGHVFDCYDSEASAVKQYQQEAA